ncbi:unnamed protein product [Alopecurus aequalis]
MNKFNQMAKDFGTKILLRTERIVHSSIGIGYQSACDYPVVLGAGILLLLLHRICPPLLGFLVSSSPLLLLTGLLLGALLSYGDPSTPSVVGEEASDQTVPEKYKISVADCSVEEITHLEKRTGSEGFHVAQRTPTNNTHDNHWEETNVTFLAANVSLSTESTQTNVIAGRDMCVEETSEKAELQEFQSRNTETGNYEVYNHCQLGESMSQCWQSAERQDPCYDSESDLTDESSSPDASMTDIIPMLEELHPLIDLGTGHPTFASRDNLNSSSDDDEDDLEDDDDDVSDVEDEGEEEEKSDGNNQEDAMGNNSSRVDGLMELQRAKNILKFELNQRLVDLQTADATEKLKEASRFYVQVPSISTPREKPFGPSNVSDEVIELPQIPDSAPSVLLPRQNLFDDHDSQLQETWTPRLYSPETQLRKYGNLDGRQSTSPHLNGLKSEKGEITGEDALGSYSDSDATEQGNDGKLSGSHEAHMGEEIKIVSTASSGADVLKVDIGRHEDNNNADFSVNSFPIMKNGPGTSEAKDSAHAGSEKPTLCCLSKANNSEQHLVEANSIDEVNSLFRCRMEEVLVQSISEPVIGQPLTVKLEVESSNPPLSSDSVPIQEKSGEVFPAVGEHSPELSIGNGYREPLTVEDHQITDSSDLHVMEVGSVEVMNSYDMLAPETEPVKCVGSTLEQLKTGHNKMVLSQDDEVELKTFELNSALQVKEAQALDSDSGCDSFDIGLKVTELEDSAEKPKSIVVKGKHEEDA